jgi:Dual specificity phosphatase, catalytic domain
MVRIPAWTVIGDNLILGAHPAKLPSNVDAIANVDSFRFYDVPEGVIYLHFAYWDTDAVPDATELDVVTTFLNDLRAAGETVFVHCRLGLNRSALLAGLMLVDEGYRAKDAIELMRDLVAPRSSKTGRSSSTCSRWTVRVEATRLQRDWAREDGLAA